MIKRNGALLRIFSLLVLVIMVTLFTTSAFAGTVTLNDVSLTVPDSYVSCQPTDTIKVSGIPEGGSVRISFFIEVNGSLSNIGSRDFSNVSGGMVSVGFPYPAMSTGSVTFSVGVSVWNIPTVDPIAKLGGKWTVTCAPPTNTPVPTKTPVPTPTATPTTPPEAGQGCTPGYWRQDQHFDSWIGFAPGNDFEIVFGVDATFAPHTLLDAVWIGGGGEFAMARHAVAALLNSTTSGVDFAYSTSQVISMVQSAYASRNFEGTKNLFAAQNEMGCPLN